MATKFYAPEGGTQIFKDVALKGEAKSYEFDLSQWADANSDITSVSWEVRTGNAAVSGTAETDNVISGLVTFSDSGGNLIKITATGSGGEICVAYLDVLAKDPYMPAHDYGFCA